MDLALNNLQRLICHKNQPTAEKDKGVHTFPKGINLFWAAPYKTKLYGHLSSIIQIK